MATVLIPLPDNDFDTTEVSVPWQYLRAAGHDVVFATERGAAGPVPACDHRLLDGVIFGQLGADDEPKQFYETMRRDPAFTQPLDWAGLEPETFDGLLLPGGHAPGMRQYLASSVLQDKVGAFWDLGRPVGAICHGVLVLARTTDDNGRSVLGHRFTTCLPKYMERTAYSLTSWKLGTYYRTYPAYVEDEVREALDDPSRYVRGPRTLTRRGTATDDSPAFAVRDENYLSARWPGDAYLFAKSFVAMLAGG